MKRSFLIICLTFLSVATFAQGNVRFGFTTTPGLSWYSSDSKYIDTKGVRFSFNYGAIVDYVIDDNERYTITSGLTIDMSGGHLNGNYIVSDSAARLSTGTYSSSLTTKLQYLEIPIGLKLRSNESSNNFTFYGTLGIVNGFRIRSRGAYNYSIDGEEMVNEKNIKIKDLTFYPNDIKKIAPYQLSLHFEAGTEFRISDNTSLVGGFYFRNGFTNVVNDKDNERVVSRGIGFRLGVMF